MDESQSEVESHKKKITSFVTLIFISIFFISNPISLPSRCKILSTRIDIRSSKICELGLFDHKAKNLFNPFEGNRFLCRYDYYWASVFKVEYKHHFSSRTRVALSEAPNEALPIHCRPSFGAALLIQFKFKVNESYDCWYTPGISKVHLSQDDLFSCHADKPTTLRMVRQYFILTMEMLYSWFTWRGRVNHWNWEMFLRFICVLLSGLCRFGTTRIFHWPVTITHIWRACLLLAFCSFVAWLAVEYGKMLGLMDIVRVPDSWHLFL